MKNTKRIPVKVLSLLLVLLITISMVPTTALASDADLDYTWETGAETVDDSQPTVTVAASTSPKSETDFSGNPQASDKSDSVPLGLSGTKGEILPWALNLHQLAQKPSTYSVNGISTASIIWGGGNIEFGSGTYYVGSGYIYRITHSGGDAFCAEFNGNMAGGSYIKEGEGSNSVIRQVIANYEASNKTDNDYIAAQVKIWSILIGQPVTSWGGSNPNMNIINGTSDSSEIKYFNHKNTNTPHTQNIITFVKDDVPHPPDPPEIPEPNSSTITIYKRDVKTNQVLAGAVFEVRNIGGGSYGTYTTNSSGVATINIEVPKIGLGLVITEVAPPAGYYLSENNVQDVFISYQQASASVTFVNDPAEQGELVIYKLDSKTGKVLAGAVFEVRNAGGGVLGTITTDASGKGALPIHDVPREGITLVVEEKSPPPNYYLSDDNVKDVHIPYGSTSASVTFVNDPVVKGEIIVYKRDAKTGALLAGCVLEIREINGGVLGVVTTDASGKGALPVDIPREGLGLVITELSPPPGYYLSDDNVKDVFIPYGHTSAEVTFVNDPILKSELHILKISARAVYSRHHPTGNSAR